MASSELSARLLYLNSSAHVLSTEATSTSRYLMARHNSLIFNASLERPDSHRQEACGSCGNMMIMGWQATLRVQSQRIRRQKGNTKRSCPKEIVLNCEVCDRNTRISLNPVAPRYTVRPTKNATQERKRLGEAAVQPESNSGTVSANSSSKRRAKARKGGLGALLASKKASDTASTGFGLDLMDFMKKS